MNESEINKLIENKITDEEFIRKAELLSERKKSYDDLGLSEAEIELFKRLGKAALPDIVEARRKKEEIIQKWKSFFRKKIAQSHEKNTKKLANINEFNLNPFLDNYKANFLLGDSSALSKATALVYARALGASINTSFGTNLQRFCSSILSGYASTTAGIDIEFKDFVDGRKKYCQIKAGPNTINKDDIKTIIDHFNGVKNLARTNGLSIGLSDLVVGVFYGERKDLSAHYLTINREFPVYIGQDFWYRLTGDANFYKEMTTAIDEVAAEYDGRTMLRGVIDKLAKEIEKAES